MNNYKKVAFFDHFYNQIKINIQSVLFNLLKFSSSYIFYLYEYIVILELD